MRNGRKQHKDKVVIIRLTKDVKCNFGENYDYINSRAKIA